MYTWGSRPRLYAFTCFAGLLKGSSAQVSGGPLLMRGAYVNKEEDRVSLPPFC